MRRSLALLVVVVLLLAAAFGGVPLAAVPGEWIAPHAPDLASEPAPRTVEPLASASAGLTPPSLRGPPSRSRRATADGYRFTEERWHSAGGWRRC